MPRIKSPLKILYLDIETTPHYGSFWSLFPKFIPIGQLLQPTELLCWAAKWEGDRETMFRKHNDRDMVKKMWDLLNEADCVIHYYGKSFDMKHLNREFVKKGLPPPSHYHQIDLLQEVKRNFKMASYKLDFVVNYFGLGAKVKHVGMELWYGCINDEEKHWKVMERYNRMDVKLLPKLYKFMLPWIKSHPNLGLCIRNPTSLLCPTCASQAKHTPTGTFNSKTQRYDSYKCVTCGTPFRTRSTNKKASTFLTVRIP